MAWCALALMSQRALSLTLAGIFAFDLVVCWTFVMGKSFFGRDDPMLGYVVRLLLFPLLGFIACRLHYVAARQSPIVAMRLGEEQRLARQHVASDPLTTAERGRSRSLQLLSNGSCPPDETEPPSRAGGQITRHEDAQRRHCAVMDKANLRRDLATWTLFLLACLLSLYSGLLVVGQEAGFKAFLLTLVVALINVEQFLVLELVRAQTNEKGETIEHLHMHPLFFTTNLKSHSCDVCQETMEKPLYIAYRCRTCDFDLCLRCYRKKDNPQAVGQACRIIRREGQRVTTWTYFTRILSMASTFWHLVVIALGGLLVGQGMRVWAPTVQGSIFDGIIAYLADKTGDGLERFNHAVVTYAIISATQGFFSGVKSLAQELVMRNLAASVRLRLYRSVIQMDIAFFDAMHTGQLTSRLSNDASQMVEPLETLMNDLVANIVLLIGGTTMAFLTSWKLSVLALTVVPPVTYVYRVYARWARSLYKSIYCSLGEANTSATQAIRNIRTVRGFSMEDEEVNKYQESILNALQHGKRNAYCAALVTTFSTYLNLGTSVLVLWYGGHLVCVGGELTIGRLITFQLYWNMMNSAFISLGDVFNDLIRSSSAAERVCSLIDARPEVDLHGGELVDPTSVQGHVELNGVEFFYVTRPENRVIKKVDLDLRPGSTTALVGRSGGGKSTLLHLLMRFYEPTGGSIALDGKNVASLSPMCLRELCGFVSQETQLFACSVEENVSYGLGRPHTKAELESACRSAGAHDFIQELEEGYETRVGENGVRLSGGQRQRLAIARCFLRRPRMLFLDEATSALDAENEGAVQQALEDLIQDLRCTVVMVAHRLSTVRGADQIAVVHGGCIVERGTHEELVARDGIYAKLVARQLAGTGSQATEGTGDSKRGTEIDQLMEEIEQ